MSHRHIWIEKGHKIQNRKINYKLREILTYKDDDRQRVILRATGINT